MKTLLFRLHPVTAHPVCWFIGMPSVSILIFLHVIYGD